MEQPSGNFRGITIPHHWLRILFIAACGALALFLINLAVEGYRGYGFIGGSTKSTNITVTGNGEITATPDTGTITVSVESLAGTQKVAQDTLAKKMEGVLVAIKQAGVADADVKTDNYNVSNNGCDYYNSPNRPVSQYSPMPPSNCSSSDYTASQNITVTLHNLANLQTLLSGIGARGGQISSVSLDASNINALRDQAQQKAITDAKTKAQKTASGLGVRLGRVVSFDNYDDSGGYPTPLYENSYSSGDAIPTVPTGEQKITSQVSVTFEIY